MDFDKLMAKARATNASRDAAERSFGWAAPPDISPEMHLATAASAIECGIRVKDWECVAEGLAMIQDVLEAVNPARKPTPPTAP